MKPKKPPRLYAIYGPDGELLTSPKELKSDAWWDWGWKFPGKTRKGFTCEEVEIVRVQK